MRLSVSTLLDQLVLPHGMLAIAPQALQLGSAADAFAQHLPDGVLRVMEATADHERLEVAGRIELTGRAMAPGKVSFLTSPGGNEVAGVRADVVLKDVTGLPEELKPAFDLLKAVSSLGISAVHLVLGIEPGPTGDPMARIGFGVELDFHPGGGDTRPYLWGYLPLDPAQAWSLSGSFLPVAVPKIDDLKSFAKQTSESAFTLPPALATVAGGLALTDLVITFAAPGKFRTAGFIQSVWLRVCVEKPWTICDGLTVVDAHAEFGVIQPFGSPRLQALIGGTVELADGVLIGAEISWQDQRVEVSGSLLRPVKVEPLLKKHFPDFPAKTGLTVSELSLHGEFGGASAGYGLSLVLDDALEITDSIKLSDVVLTVNKQGTSTEASLDAVWQLGDSTTVQVGGAWSTEGGWQLYATAQEVKPAEIFRIFGITPPPVLADATVELLGISYHSKTAQFGLDVRATVRLGDITVALGLEVALTKKGEGNTGYDQTYTGRLVLSVPRRTGEPRLLAFTLKDVQNAEFTALLTDSQGVTFKDLAELLGVQETPVVDFLGRLGAIDKVAIGYSSTRKSFVFAVHEKDHNGSLVVASVRPKEGPREWVMCAALGLNASLSQVPLLRGQIPAGDDIGVRGLGVLYASGPLTTQRMGEFNQALAAVDWVPPQLPAEGMAKGVAFTVNVQLPGATAPASLMVKSGGGTKQLSTAAEAEGTTTAGTPATHTGADSPTASTPQRAGAGADGGPGEVVEGVVLSSTELARAAQGTPTAGAPTSPTPTSPAAGGGAPPLVAWVNVQRSVGPLRLRRVGVSYADNKIWVLFDASLGMAGLTLGVEGLGIGVSLDGGSVAFTLDGLSAGYDRPPLTIMGALVNRPDGTYAMLVEGALVISVKGFGLTALGAYSRPRTGPDQPSMFLFGKVTGQFGGPPPVDVTGIMAGFGYNTSLRVPEANKVLDFPFLKDLDTIKPGDDPMVLLDGLMTGKDPWVRPDVGQMWFAAGLTFTVFEFLKCQALLVLEVGDDFAVAVLGTAEARFPQQGSTAYAQARLGMSVKYRASEGVLKLTAQLAPGSYVIDEACVLTGGFALYVWLDDTHAGDFVLTLGGYHPRYPVPKHYPAVPRLGFSWPVTSELTISGGAYFALTPGAIMAGGALEVNYRSGDLHAWLTAHADMLIEWAPFRFDVGIGISIGVSFVLDLWLVRETIRVEVGADLQLWGPPTAGTVTVHLWFIKFTVSFGADTSGERTGVWSDVRRQLPADSKTAVRLAVTAGLIPVKSKATELWVIGPGAFSFALRTTVPVTTLRLGTKSARSVPGRQVNLRPLGKAGKNLTSTFILSLAKGAEEADLSTWTALPITSSLPAALWGPNDGTLNVTSAQQVDNQLTGVDLHLPKPTEGSSPGPVAAGTLRNDDRKPDGILPLKASLVPGDTDAGPRAERTAPATPGQPAPTGPRTPATPTAGGAERTERTERTEQTDRALLSRTALAVSGESVGWARDRLFQAMDYLEVSPGTNEAMQPDDPLVAGDLTAKTPVLHGKPTPTGPRLYVLGATNTLTPVDIHSLTVSTAAVSAAGQSAPLDLAASPDGRWTCGPSGSQHPEVMDISAGPPTKATPVKMETWVPPRPRSVAISPDSDRAFLTFAESDQMPVFNPTGQVSRHDVSMGGEIPYGVVPGTGRWWSAEKKWVYVALPAKGQLLPVDVTQVDNPQPSRKLLNAGPQPTRLVADPRGRWLYVINEGHATVSVVDPDPDGKGVVATLPTESDPSALAASPDGKRLYVANRVPGTVSVFDVSGATPIEWGEPLWIGPQPIALAVAPESDRLFVALAASKDIQLVDTVADPPVRLPVQLTMTDLPLALTVTQAPPGPLPSAAAAGDTTQKEGDRA
ncbi:DUF6603 domain-containing protein [Streptomyces sp. NPDC088258]|uniref:DUF6603 domain-containing protein n=1 Tax=Streptomyces sp. NPDC088258 TaxID=3365849 RepID=UPI0038250F4F